MSRFPPQDTSRYAAPAARVLTCLHIPEPGAAVGQAAGMEPLTRCGLVMAGADLWQVTERQPGDRVCRFCAAGVRAGARAEAMWE